MASFRLANALRLPAIGLGTSTLPKNEKGVKIFEAAIDAGYRHIDTGAYYHNEKLIGQAVANKINEGVVKREDLFVTSKAATFMHKRDQVMKSMKQSLIDLQLDYADLYLIHNPITEKSDDPNPSDDGCSTVDVDNLETWKGMEDVYNAGLTKAIGLSNFNSKQIQRVYDAAIIKPTNLQVECHPHFQQKELHRFCEKLNIIMSAYAPLGSPNVTDVRAGWSVEGDQSRRIVLEDPVIKALSEKHKKTPAQICLRWLYQRGIIPLPKSSNIERLKSNLEIYDFHLTQDDMEAINEIPVNYRIFRQKVFDKDPNYPFNEPF